MSDANSGNFYRDDGIINGFNNGYAVNDSRTVPTGNVLTEAGAFSLADSFYGTFDQGGNVWEWNDAINGSVLELRGLRGGSWDYDEEIMRSSFRIEEHVWAEGYNFGFRVAIVPEPTAAGLMVLGIMLLAWKRK